MSSETNNDGDPFIAEQNVTKALKAVRLFFEETLGIKYDASYVNPTQVVDRNQGAQEGSSTQGQILKMLEFVLTIAVKGE